MKATGVCMQNVVTYHFRPKKKGSADLRQPTPKLQKMGLSVN